MALSPIVKWAGGKKKILPEFTDLYTIAKPNRFVDLFCGSLSIPLSIQPAKAIINDINTGLINMYKVVQQGLPSLLKELAVLNSDEYNSKEAFCELRDEFNACKKDYNMEVDVRFAALFIYLNKRSYNGLYRENRSGEYNVPYREYKTNIYDKEELKALSTYFKNNDIQFLCQDYSEFDISQFDSGDLIYLDPPYYPSKKSQFTSYWSTPFLVEEQKKLAIFCKRLDKAGIKFILSNSPCQEIRDLYKDFHQHTFYIGRQMRSGEGKSKVFDAQNEPNEILVWNFQGLSVEN